MFVRCVALTVEQIRREDESARDQHEAGEPAEEEGEGALFPVYPFPMEECQLVQWSESLACVRYRRNTPRAGAHSRGQAVGG